MWILFAFGSALFAGITSVLAKCGIQKTDSTVATAIRTMVVLIFSWIMVFIIGSQSQITMIDYKIWIFLVLSGLATGASWLCYFKALQLGNHSYYVIGIHFFAGKNQFVGYDWYCFNNGRYFYDDRKKGHKRRTEC